MRITFLVFVLLVLPFRAMAGLEKYTYDCYSDAKYYLDDGGGIQHQIVSVGRLGYPDGHLSGMIWFQHQLDGATYHFASQASLTGYIETDEQWFSLDFSRRDSYMGLPVDSAGADVYDLNSLPNEIGLRLGNVVSLPNGGWADFTLRCELMTPPN